MSLQHRRLGGLRLVYGLDAIENLAEMAFRDLNVLVVLQIEPKLCRRAERLGEPKRRIGGNISDCALLLPGELLILERRYSLWRGVALRIRRIPLASIKPGALVDGPSWCSPTWATRSTTWKGLSVRHTAAGDTVLTLISDDNFSAI